MKMKHGWDTSEHNSTHFSQTSSTQTKRLRKREGVSVSTISSNDLITPPGRLGLGRGVPDVRSEIGGLSEEITRLRGVVSGLAEGMRAQNCPDVGGLSSAVEGGDLTSELTDDGGRPKQFLKVSRVESGCLADHQTAHISMNIIRLIHTSLGGRTCPNADLFSEENLTKIKHHFEVLQQYDPSTA